MDESKRMLATYKKKTISLSELELMFKPLIHTYEEFAKIILQLEDTELLMMVKAKGRTHRTPSLAFQYRINKSELTGDYHKELQHYRLLFHTSINIDEYYREDPAIWKEHLPFIKKVDDYLKRYSFPQESVPAPERSYEIVGDEKWIVEKGGKEILEKIGLFSQLNIIPVSEPLMFAINPTQINEKSQFHLIVENKTTYQGLLPTLRKTSFSTLIYGCGKAVIKSIEQFPMQYPISADHHFFYFGDVDREGISIWSSLNQKQEAVLALPFYLACLVKEPATGKEYQKERSTAIKQFITHFPKKHQEQILSLLQNGTYYPQETLKTKELQEIWREADWTSLISKI
ncbi:Wadjet anti-phage system protein JetD domain-containing protein [Cytobacillus sp. Hz8]|uniref:Wadjet anti-phage system protein JetD domain-containing protein n=1 Tax=Cytobacillus sp. Hz8 TaxID=3347168 RepID=UPI0035E351D8